GATAGVSIDALLLPDLVVGPEGVRTTHFKILPNTVALEGGWWLLQIRAVGLFAMLTANETLIRLGSGTASRVSQVPPPIELDPSVDSSDFQGFGGGGGTNIVLSAQLPARALNVPMDKWVIADTGVWLLGGRGAVATAAASPDASQDLI